ncbi:hypothetical protein R6Z07F_019426 [Ovis aries]
MQTLLPSSCCSPTRLHLLLSVLFFLTLLSPVRSGMGPAQNHCINLGGTCRRDICRTTEDIIAYCKRRSSVFSFRVISPHTSGNTLSRVPRDENEDNTQN